MRANGRRGLHRGRIALATVVLGLAAAIAAPAAADVLHLRFEHDPSGHTDAWNVRDPRPGRLPAHRVVVPGGPTYDIEAVLDPLRTSAGHEVVVARFEFFEVTSDRKGVEQRELAMTPAISVQVNEEAWVRQGTEGGPTVKLMMRYEKLAGRMVVDGEEVVACVAGGKRLDSAQCPLGLAEAVGIVPPTSGPLVLPVGRGTVERNTSDDPCSDARQIREIDWKAHPLGRDAAVIDPDSARYRELIGAAVGVDDVKLRVLLRVDLEGDGVDEVVFVADSHEGQRSYAGTEKRYKAYSFVGVRKVREGADVDTILLWEHRGTVDWSEPFPDLSTAWLAGFTDLDGDGGLELVVGANGYEWYHNTVYRIEGGEAVRLGGSGCAL